MADLSGASRYIPLYPAMSHIVWGASPSSSLNGRNIKMLQNL